MRDDKDPFSGEIRRFAARVTVQCAGAAPREATIHLAYVYWLFPPSTGQLDEWELLIDDWELLIGSDSPPPGDAGR